MIVIGEINKFAGYATSGTTAVREKLCIRNLSDASPHCSNREIQRAPDVDTDAIDDSLGLLKLAKIQPIREPTLSEMDKLRQFRDFLGKRQTHQSYSQLREVMSPSENSKAPSKNQTAREH